MDALIENAVVITCDAEGSVIENGAIAVLGKRIEEVGESGGMRRKYESLDRIDASGRAVMPGFVNAHTHSVLTVASGHGGGYGRGCYIRIHVADLIRHDGRGPAGNERAGLPGSDQVRDDDDG